MSEFWHWIDVAMSIFGMFYAFFGRTRDVRFDGHAVPSWAQFLARLTAPFIWIALICFTAPDDATPATSA